MNTRDHGRGLLPRRCDACSSGKEASRGPSARQEEGATLCDACAQGMYDDDSDGGAIDALSAETPCIDCEAGRIASTAGQVGSASVPAHIPGLPSCALLHSS